MKKILLKIYSFIQKNSGFKIFGSGSLIKGPSKIWNKGSIEMGKSSFIAENCFLAVSTKDSHGPKKFSPVLKIGNNVCIGSSFFAACIKEIIIEDNVLISDRVFVSDHIHEYKNIHKPIINQQLIEKGTVRIKKGAFIGINAVIMPGVTVGKNSVIGASSLVNKDVPDYSVVVGNPAKIIKIYDIKSKKWLNVREKK